ncbi:DCG1-like protein [Cladophialophora carrionii]|uniref:DCG1-like protein n=1 Tax=Cladophialophora carrionii TaxID=86049 RepID=A0A1C1CDX9_9EURO|nr:DCG1-like protein [Cladophialophora carrionii]
MTTLEPEPEREPEAVHEHEDEHATATGTAPPVRILIINPNTSQHMTDALGPVVDSLRLPSTQYTFFTCPSPGIPSINSPADAAESARICLPHVIPLLDRHDCVLVACYSQHPLVAQLKSECAKLERTRRKELHAHGHAHAHADAHDRQSRKYVTGIFEASVLASLGLIDKSGDEASSATAAALFGIVSTGKIWETALQRAVEEFIGVDVDVDVDVDGQPPRPRRVFVGCETTGLNASELHDLDGAEVRAKMMDATKRLLRKGGKKKKKSDGDGGDGDGDGDGRSISRVQAICLGCAGMVGLDDAVRTACVEELGDEAGKAVYIVDGVKAGVGLLYGLAKGGF